MKKNTLKNLSKKISYSFLVYVQKDPRRKAGLRFQVSNESVHISVVRRTNVYTISISKSIYIYRHIYRYTYITVCICEYTYIYTHVCMRVFTHACVHI